MADARDFQTSRHQSLISAGSALDMEMKRRKIRESVLFSQTQDPQQKLDLELRMREGAYKLLLACSKREQVLNASKNLLTCSARIKTYTAQVERRKHQQKKMEEGRSSEEGRVSCRGSLALSGLRFPLMWKDQDHFNNRGSSRRVAVFALLQVDSQVFETEMVVVDRTVTDICFEGVTIFKDVVPKFELKVELWSCALEEELTVANTPKKLAKKFRNSLGKSSARKLCPLLAAPDPDAFLQHNPIPHGAKYNLLSCTSLGLNDAEGNFQSHSLIVLQDASYSSWLPLYGNVCCLLLAQPSCMTEPLRCGYLEQQETISGTSRCCSFYAVLSAGRLSCFFSPEEVDAKVPASLIVPVDQDTRVHVLERASGAGRSRRLVINSPGGGAQTFRAESAEDLDQWREAVQQHVYDQSQWLHCCQMTLDDTSPRQPSLFLTKQPDCVYEDLSINSPVRSVTDIISDKISQTNGRFLLSHGEDTQAPDWSVLFHGSQSLLVHKSLSPGETSTPARSPAHNVGSTPRSGKKRQAPPPPSDRQPYAPPPPSDRQPYAPPPASWPEKENDSRPPRSRTGRPSLDAKFSAIVQQLQRSQGGGASAASRKNAPLRVLEVPPPSQTPLDPLQSDLVRPGSGPAPMSKLRKSFRERLNLKPQ